MAIALFLKITSFPGERASWANLSQMHLIEICFQRAVIASLDDHAVPYEKRHV
jgi:hypothetical protein